MAMQKKIIVLGLSLSLLIVYGNGQSPLSWDFYDLSCPSVDVIVSGQVAQMMADDDTIAATFVRMHFHDCFVRGCDASILLNSTENNAAEKEAKPNLTLRGFVEIDAIKAAVEKLCPGVVSCADIIALAARASVVLSGGTLYQLPLGRRDGVESHEVEPSENLPPPFGDFKTLSSAFSAKNLTDKDLVVLSGAHTIGVSHCSSFSSRLYNFSSTNPVDPTLNWQYAQQLQSECPLGDADTEVPMDPITPTLFDTNYYLLVSQGKGLFQSDAALLNNSFTNSYVQSRASLLSDALFAIDFGVSMVKMGEIEVLTGTQGEIRKICSVIN